MLIIYWVAIKPAYMYVLQKFHICLMITRCRPRFLDERSVPSPKNIVIISFIEIHVFYHVMVNFTVLPCTGKFY